MADQTQWSFPPELQAASGDLAFDLTRALDAVVALRVEVPGDAFTASILGTERAGNGVVIRDDGLVLTIGYLITEAESIWLTSHAGAVVPGHALAYDQVTGLGLVQPLARLDAPAMPTTSLDDADLDGDVFVIGAGGRAHALRARIFARREFAGYWEYLLDEALFTTPPHPEWRRARRRGGAPRGDRLAVRPGGRGRRHGERQHVRAERPARSDPRRPAAPRPRRSTAAPVARRLHGGDEGRPRDPGHRAGRPGGTRRRACGRHRPRR